MPNYSFLCENGHEFDQIVHSSDHQVKCLYCNKIARRQFSCPNVIIERHSNPRYDPIEGRELSKEEIRDIKRK